MGIVRKQAQRTPPSDNGAKKTRTAKKAERAEREPREPKAAAPEPEAGNDRPWITAQ